MIINPARNLEILKLESLTDSLGGRIENNISNNVLISAFDETNNNLLYKFLLELMDYEEFLFVIKKKLKNENFSTIITENEKRRLYQYTKNLYITNPTEKDLFYKVNLVWHDIDEGINILEETLAITKINFTKFVVKELNLLLDIKKNEMLLNDQKTIEFLTEQSVIAKELGILENSVDNVELSESNVLFNINSNNIAYYLRGSKAIDKEISLIKNRKYTDLDFIEKEITKLENDDNRWIDYNKFLVISKSNSKTRPIITLCFLIGLLISFFYVRINYENKYYRDIRKK